MTLIHFQLLSYRLPLLLSSFPRDTERSPPPFEIAGFFNFRLKRLQFQLYSQHFSWKQAQGIIIVSEISVNQ